VYTETKAQFGYSSTACNNATISINQVDIPVSSSFNHNRHIDK
jgi:hypothetical protein